MPYLLTTAPATAVLPLPRREPAALAAGAQAVLAAALSLAAYWWPDQLRPGIQGAVLAATGAVAALVTAWRVAPARATAVYGVAQTLVPLAVALGLALPPGADAAILALVAAALGLLTRQAVTPRAALAASPDTRAAY
ncbi:hypothetical protein [Frankia sp. AgB32]|uniref:hypothetical protein n=1 Tax=Frankia sp. AgB32 TaxID=631119 RepID=UPI00200C8602|nr:hypothetical protein [Frankia sp. AgB32]MCK9896988.1 hypothetical protein [Frankia sp. AgB32]